MPSRASTRPIASLMTDVASDMAYLVQTEFRLARAEVAEKATMAANAGVFLAAGAAVLILGLAALLFDIARWLAVAGLPYEWALLLVALVTLVVGGVLVLAGMNRMKAEALIPNRTLAQVREDYVVAKEHVG